MLHKLDPFVRFASDLFDVSYEEGEKTLSIKDKHLIVAILGIRDQKPRKKYIDQYAFGHLFPYDGSAIIYEHEAASLDKYYHLTEHLDGKYPFSTVTDKIYRDNRHINIPRAVANTLEKLFHNEGFAFIFLCDYEDPEMVLTRINDSCKTLNDELKNGDIATDFGLLAAVRDFLPQISEKLPDKEKKPDLEKIMCDLAIIESYQEAIRDLTREVQFLLPAVLGKKS
ncbi:hypothetical protein IK146_00405 [Candidatus Saccharibacteria bacterium]|nr:hypothetical protein [Candidatus Saccharibacteria bacterium]